MATDDANIGNQTRAQVLEGITNSSTTEASFVSSVTQLINQVSENTYDLETSRSLNVTGDVAGTHPFHLDAPGDSELDIVLNLTTNAIETANIQDNAVTTSKIGPDAVTLGTKTSGNYVQSIVTAADSGLSGGVNTEGGDATLTIPDSGVTTARIADSAVTNVKLADGTIANGKLSNNQITLTGFGGGRDVTVALGATGTIPTFAADSDGLVPAYNGTELRSTSDRAVLASDGNWYTVESWALSTSETIPASRVATTGESRQLSYEADSDYSGTTYPNTTTGAINFTRTASNRLFGLGRNDTISVTETSSNTVYVLSYIGNGVNASTDAAAADFVNLGSVDAYTAGTGLTLLNNQFSITNGGVGTTQLANTGVTTAKISDSAVTTSKIADANVTTAKIADSNVTTAKIADGAVTRPKIAVDAVDSEHLADGAVERVHINASGTLSAGRLLALDASNNLEWIDGGNVIGESVISYHNITTTAGTTAYTLPDGATAGNAAIVYVNGVVLHEATDYSFNAARTVITLTSAVSAGLNMQIAAFANANALGNGSITNANLVSNAVSTIKIQDDAVTQAKIADDAVGSDQIATGAVGDDALEDITLGNWTIVSSSNQLQFRYNGATRFQLDNDGHFHAEDDITAFDTLSP